MFWIRVQKALLIGLIGGGETRWQKSRTLVSYRDSIHEPPTWLQQYKLAAGSFQVRQQHYGGLEDTASVNVISSLVPASA